MKIIYISVSELTYALIIKVLPQNSLVRFCYYANNGYSTFETQLAYLLDRQEFFKLQII